MGTQLQDEAGIEVTPVEIIQTEMEEAQMVTNGALWNRFINASGDNVEWLIEQGVKMCIRDSIYGDPSSGEAPTITQTPSDGAGPVPDDESAE